MKKIAVLALALVLTSPALAQSYPTIVGSWYLPEYGQRDCQSHNGLHIEPLGLLNEETRCEFTNVSRNGWTVTWHGQCGFSGEWVANVKVTATETNGSLSLRYNDGEPRSGFQRCP